MNRLSSALRAPFALLASIAMAAGLLVASVSVASSAQAAPYSPDIEINLPNGQVSKPYLSQVSVEGGRSPYRYEVYGDLPSGVTLNGKGQLVGRPTESGCFYAYIYVYDRRGNYDYDYDEFLVRTRNGSTPNCALQR